jgi:hypothetical protein
MAFFFPVATLEQAEIKHAFSPSVQSGQAYHPAVNLSDLETIVTKLPLCAPDMRHEVDTLAAAWSVHSGRLATALKRLEVSPSDERAAESAHTHCGAAILAIAAAAKNFGIDLEHAIRAGEQELRS